MQGDYRITYVGDLLPGRALDDVVPRLAAKFKLGEDVARDLILRGRGRVLKKGLTAIEAERYRRALDAIGLQVSVEPSSGSADGDAPVPAGTTDVGSRSSSERGRAEPVGRAGAMPEVGPEGTAASRCPKCGADAVSDLTGVCQACGLVVDRYLANRMDRADEPDAARNPYRPPRADLTPPGRLDSESGSPPDPVPVPIGRGIAWIAEAWSLFKDQPLGWIGALILFYLMSILVSLVPLIGGVASMLLTPMLSAGLMIGARQQDRGDRFRVRALFAGISGMPGPLALVGLLYLGLGALVGVVTALLIFAAVVLISGGPDLSGLEPADLALIVESPAVLLPILVALLLSIPLAMGMFFAPSLVALDRVPVLRAFGLSLRGCIRNILPFLAYGVAALVMAIIGALPLMLGLLVVLPVLTISVYTSYRDIYHGGSVDR